MMTLKIGKAGRVIQEPAVRSPQLIPADRKSSLIKRGRFWVHTGELPLGYDLRKAIDDDRDDRTRKAWGPVA